MGITGFGIDTEEGDGGTEVYIDHENQTVRFKSETFKFEDYVAMKPVAEEA